MGNYTVFLFAFLHRLLSQVYILRIRLYVLYAIMHIAKKGDGTTGPLVSLETRCYYVKVNSKKLFYFN